MQIEAVLTKEFEFHLMPFSGQRAAGAALVARHILGLCAQHRVGGLKRVVWPRAYSGQKWRSRHQQTLVVVTENINNGRLNGRMEVVNLPGCSLFWPTTRGAMTRTAMDFSRSNDIEI